MNVPLRDIIFGKIIRWLQANGLEMHTDRNGNTWVCPKQPKRKRPAPTPDIIKQVDGG